MGGYAIEKPSTELMQNYLQSQIMSPTARFRAVESSVGALLLSIGTDGSLYATAELPGDADSHTGWQQFNLSGATVPAEFSPGGALCSQFDVARCADGTLRMAMALSDKNNAKASDALYLATITAGTEKAWCKSPAWTRFPFDGKVARALLKIDNLFLSEATDGDYTVVDVSDTPDHPGNIFRYYIDPHHKAGDPAWQPHALPIEVEADKYSSCLGRKAGADIDGIYTSGHIGDRSQMVYTPLRGRQGHDPLSASLHLPGNLVPDAISACRNPDDSSDLYAAANGSLYYFASDKQHDGAEAIAVWRDADHLLSGNGLFKKVDRLFASRSGDSALVWGLNADKQIFYVTCPAAKLADPSAWSVPLPIMSGVQHVAPFVNRANSANTFFAHTAGNELKIATKRFDPKSPGSRAWSVRDVHLRLPDEKKKQKTKAQQFHSYTTHVKVTGPDKQPAAGKLVAITAPRGATSVYINHLYYPVGSTPIHVLTDATGGVTIIEPISRLDGTQLRVALVDDVGAAKDIKPMQDAPTVSPRLQTLRTADKLVDATIHYQNEKLKPPRKLVREAKRNASDPDVKNAATNIDHLWKAHDHLTGKNLMTASSEPSERYKSFVKDKTPITVDAGDLLLLLDSQRARRAVRARAGQLGAGESLWDMIVEFFQGVWRIIVKIGEAIYAFVIEVIEDVFAAFKYVFDKIVEFIEDVIEFVKFLFDLESMQRTKDVIQHVTHLFLKDQVDYISKIRADFDSWIGSVIADMKKWADPKNRSPGSPDTIGQLQSSSQTGPASASNSYLAYHFSNNVADGFGQSEPVPPPDDSLPLLTQLENLVKREIAALMNTAAELRELASNYADKTPDDLARQFFAILGKAVLETLQNIVDALFAVLKQIADWARQRFVEDTLYIPIVSDILEEFGVPEFTVSDLFCWLSAVPLTIGYKLITGNEPFPDDELTKYLRVTAPDFASVVKRLSGGTRVGTNLAAAATKKGADFYGHRLSGAGHICSGLFAFILGGAGVFEAVSYSKENPVSNWVTGTMSCFGAADNWSRGISLFIVPRVPFIAPSDANWAIALRLIVMFHKLGFGFLSMGAASNRLPEKYAPFAKAAAPIGAATDIFLVLLQVSTTLAHFHDIRQRKSYGNEENLAIVDEVSNIFNYIARVCRDILILGGDAIPDKRVKAALAGVAAGFRFAQGVFQISEGWAELDLEWSA